MNTAESNLCRPVVRLLGNADHPEFAEAMSLLRATARPETAHAALPELIVVAQARPGEVTHREVKLIQHQHPLAGTVALLGSWCEGELRSGRALSGVTRVYWHQFVERAEAALAEQGDFAGWRLPRTATAIDVSLQLRRQKARPLTGPSVGILASRSEAMAISEALAACGVGSMWIRDQHEVPDDVVAAGVDRHQPHRRIPDSRVLPSPEVRALGRWIGPAPADLGHRQMTTGRC